MDVLVTNLKDHATNITIQSRAPKKDESEASNTVRVGVHTGLYCSAVLFSLYTPWHFHHCPGV